MCFSVRSFTFISMEISLAKIKNKTPFTFLDDYIFVNRVPKEQFSLWYNEFFMLFGFVALKCL